MSIYIRARREDGEVFLIISKPQQPTDGEEIRRAVRGALLAVDGLCGGGASPGPPWRGDLLLELSIKAPPD